MPYILGIEDPPHYAQFGRLANVTTVASVDDSPPRDLADTIRRIVREELVRHQEYWDLADRGNVPED